MRDGETGIVGVFCVVWQRLRFSVFGFSCFVQAMLVTACLCLVAGQWGSRDAVAQNAAPQFLIAKAFDEGLAQNISVAWQAQDLRSGLRGLSNVRRVAILIDRRVDPSTELDLQVKGVSLRTLLQRVVDEQSLGLSRLENAIVLGPRDAMRRLRTDIELASSQLVRHPAGITRTRELQQRETLTWPDLTAPREILDEVSRRYELPIENPQLVPHDLWAAGTLPSASAAESLLFVLSQFDLAFEWSADLKSVRLIEPSGEPAIEREFSLRRTVSETVINELQASVPGLNIELKGRRVVARGLFEQLEQAQAILLPPREQPGTRPTGPKVVMFTFEVRNAPLKDFMEKLEQQAGYSFEYDTEQLSKAGIRLDGVVSLKMKDASPDELFTAMFDPLGLRHKVDGTTVRLSLKSRTDK